jgi:hypothetical protein
MDVRGNRRVVANGVVLCPATSKNPFPTLAITPTTSECMVRTVTTARRLAMSLNTSDKVADTVAVLPELARPVGNSTQAMAPSGMTTPKPLSPPTNPENHPVETARGTTWNTSPVATPTVTRSPAALARTHASSRCESDSLSRCEESLGRWASRAKSSSRWLKRLVQRIGAL